MGNTDSHSGFTPAPSSALRFPARREEVPSARSWWRSTQAGSRSRGRGHTNQHLASWTYEHAFKDPRGAEPPQICLHGGGYGEDGGYREDGGRSDRTHGERTSVESGGSPKVLLRKDGTVRVEFTNSRVVSGKPQGLGGVAAATVATVATAEPSLRTSKGSLLSSDGSWYDSPWGTGSEFADNVFVNSSGCTAYFSARTEEAIVSPPGGYTGFFSAQVDVPPGINHDFLPRAERAVGYTSCSSGRTEDSGIGDSIILPAETTDISQASPRHTSPLHPRHNALPAFPTSLDAVPPLDDVIQEEQGTGGVGQLLYSSQTLPCHRANPASATSGSNRKDFLKSRIRQLSDWTGSLSRKKRRIQEPIGSNTELAGCSTLWSSNPLHTLNQIQNQLPVPAGLCGSSRSLNPSDLQRQNVYDSFMQELETGRSSSAAERTEPSDGDEEEEETLEEEEKMDGEEEVGGGGEQRDVLLEKDQGVVRRAGWLSFKALLAVSRDRKLEPVARRRWRHFWVTLKGCTLLFYETYRKKASGEQELSPRYALLADDSIVQAVPEHPRREHVFCLSNAHGDVYLFQATNQTDLENWVTAIHSASAALLARRQGTEDTLRLLRRRSRSLLHKIDTDSKMKKMAELQLSVIKEPKSRRAVQSQIQQWNQNLEKLNLDLFRLRCYQSSLQGGELPNPKGLLAVASRPSKSMLGRLGVFSVSSFHALVCSRDEAALRSRTQSGGRLGRRGLPSSLRTLDGLSSRASGRSTSQELRCVVSHREVVPPAGHPVAVQETEELQTSRFHVFSLHVCRLNDDKDFGFAVTGHVDGGGRSHIYVGEVDPVGLSARRGLRAGDEVLAVNGTAVSGLDLDLMQSLFNQQKLQLLLLRRDESPGLEEATVTISWPQAGDPHQHPASPAPPAPLDVQAWISGAVSRHSDGSPLEGSDDVMAKRSEDVETQNMDQVFPLYHTFPEGRATEADIPRNPYIKEAGLPPTSPAHLSVCQRLRKVIQELVDTEKSYVKDLVRLFDVYLTPLQKETFLSKDEMEALFGSLPEMLDFQRVFLQTLEDRISSCPDFSSLETPGQFKTLLFSLGGSFLYYADHFKHYSGFCVNHIKVQKVLERAKTDAAFKHFLEARNPTNQHSSSLESYLIKPIQRVLKYPLLLKELVSLTDPGSPEHAHLTEALRAMEKVASHINEMQKIYEDYGTVFDQLAAEQSGTDRQVTEISMGEFLVQSSVGWLNPLPCLGRLRREPELTLFVFKRAVVLVCRDSSRLKKRPSGSRSADPDPFRFRWLIPVSALQVRPTGATASENPCVWELVHRRSEAEGRPETVFTLCSSCLGSKASVLRVLRSLLRGRAPSGSLRRTRPSSAERSASWRRRRQQQRCRSSSQRTSHLQSDGGSTLGETCSEPLLPSHAPSDSARRRTRLCSLTGELEAQLQRLNFKEEEAQRGDEEVEGRGWSAQRSPADVLDVLDRDFSVHSMASIINEDCFYDSVMSVHAPAIPTLQG